jgi:2'-5' RNA ligase
MYFALIPDEKTKADLAALVQDPPEEFHLTLLFSPDRETRIPPEEVEALWREVQARRLAPRQLFSTGTAGLHNFGPVEKKVWSLPLWNALWLSDLRQRCEERGTVSRRRPNSPLADKNFLAGNSQL